VNGGPQPRSDGAVALVLTHWVQAIPMTFQLYRNGKQFVLIAAGGHGKLGTTLGDSLVAFALP